MADIIVELDQQDHLEFDLKQEDQRDIDLEDVKAVVIGGIEYEEDPVDSGFVKYNAETEKYSTVAGDDTKLDKNTTVTSTPQIYAKNADGTQTMLNAVQYYSDDRNGIARYINGNLIVNSPTENGHASTKKYVDDKFNGASKPYTYDTYPEMITALNAMSATDINRGQDIMVVQTGIPDVWVAYIEETSVPYTYVDDETFINELLTNGTVQVGYYKLGYLETQKVDLTDYVKYDDDPSTEKGGVVRIPTLNYGLEFVPSQHTFRIKALTDTKIENRQDYGFEAVTLAKFDKTLKASMTDNKEEWSEEEKASARELIGVNSILPTIIIDE